MIELLRDLAVARGHTVIIVTHDSRIFPLADRLVRIDDGRIASDTAVGLDLSDVTTIRKGDL
jgi:putative ABC transport system ATP-binding protein